MRKLLGMLIFLFILYLSIQFAFTYFGKGEKYSYEIVKDDLVIGVDEVSTFKTKKDNYYYNIFINETKFSFQINENFNKLTQVITDVEYFKNEKYECLLPIFKNKLILTDFMCYKDNELTYYYNLINEDTSLDKFVNSISLYDKTKWQDNATYDVVENVQVYKNNLVSNHYIGFTNYKGIYNISKEFNSLVYNINLYKNDVYNQKVGSFLDRYYISADYNESYEFNKFNVVDLVKLDTFTVISNTKISQDSYIQGVVDNKVYLYDKDNKKQYEINIEKKSVVEVGSTEIKFYDGTWTKVPSSSEELKFIVNKNDYIDSKYARIDKIDSVYYLYEKMNDIYKVYKMNEQDKNKIFLFNTGNINNIFYIDNYIYFVDHDTIKLYRDQLGVKSVVSYSELQFNKNINLSIYSR